MGVMEAWSERGLVCAVFLALEGGLGESLRSGARHERRGGGLSCERGGWTVVGSAGVAVQRPGTADVRHDAPAAINGFVLALRDSVPA